MGGVDVELKYLLDNETSCEDRCQQFALTNSVRCRPRSNSAASQATSEMKHNCASHTQAIIQALEPDIIIAQGAYPREGLRVLFKPCILHEMNNKRSYKLYRSAEIGQAEIQGKKCLFLLTAHPARYPGFRWREGCLPYEVKGIFAQARELYSGVRSSYCIEETNVSDQPSGRYPSRKDMFFNTNETNALGAYQKMFSQGVLAIFGYETGPQKLKGSTANQRVFAYVNDKGILGAGRVVNGQVIPGNSVFGRCHEHHVKVEWETIVAEDRGITIGEVKGKHDYDLPCRHTFCQLHCCPDVTDWIADELRRRAT